jgi:hypothetical protein
MISLALAACEQPAPQTPITSVDRIGAECVDGSDSQATGSGACSSHGGVACWKLSDGTCQPTANEAAAHRTGAKCNDGTASEATGSGACSSHDGVKCWKYSDGSCRTEK